MPAYIHQIATDVPETTYSRETARDFMKEHVADRDALKRILHRVYAMSDIDKRHSVIEELQDGKSGIFFDGDTNTFLSPTTGQRNDLYTREAKKIYTRLAQKTLDESAFNKEDITHVITVSCTGFFAPGPDYFVVKALGLSPSTRRYHLGFMGCYAAFPALKMAESICVEQPDAVVLVVTLELCTIHLQQKTDMDALISASVFADGAASAIVSAREPEHGRPAYRINGLHTALTPQGEEDMAWTIGDSGFDMVLSTYIPDIIEANLNNLLEPLLGEGFDPGQFGYWAVHPGGRAILDKVHNALELRDEAIAPSREVLRNYGNMSSATILFVLKNILYHSPPTDKPVIGMAFGPGLTVETGFFEAINAKPKHSNTFTEPHAATPA
ncbi:MAG: type III polyketide synthase [Balneolia bacterium]|nr:type III polyketide synthase [Balneolia bacterium]